MAALQDDATAQDDVPATTLALVTSPIVSLYTIAGIRTENAMLLPVSVHGTS